MPVDMRQPHILIELNGADPLHTASLHGTVKTTILDWDEIEQYTNTDLVHIHDAVEEASPRTARCIRDVLRERGMALPAYDADLLED